MKINRTYKYRLYPTVKQQKTIDYQLGLLRKIYNKFLKQRIDIYEKKGVSINYYHQCKQLQLIKQNKPEYADIYSQSLQSQVKILDTAFQNFFRRVKKGEKPGFPRFKGKGRINSIHYPQMGFKIVDGKLKLSKIGHIKLKQHREIDGKIKTCTITKTKTNKYYVCFVLEKEIEVKEARIEKAVGVDMGLELFAQLSDGLTIQNPRTLKKYKAKLLKANRSLSKKKKGSKNKDKARKKVAKIHEKVVNTRLDFMHNQANFIIQNYDLIAVEKLLISNMTKSSKGTLENPGKMVKQKSGLNRSILDASWGKFFEILIYKAEEANKIVQQVNPQYTSQKCSSCGFVFSENRESQSIFNCKNCGFEINADLNASINIRNEAQKAVGCTVKACGGHDIGQPMKQEANTNI